MKKVFAVLVLSALFVFIAHAESSVRYIPFGDSDEYTLAFDADEKTLAVYDKNNAVADDACSVDYDIASRTYRVKVFEKYGFLDDALNWIIEPSFDWAAPFGADGISEIQINGLWGYINLDGTFLFEPVFKGPGWGYEWFDENGIAVVIKDGLYAYIKSDGTYLFEPQFEDAEVFANGIARIKYNGKYGYILLNGTYLFEPQFDEADQFFNEITVVSQNGLYGLVDPTGNFILTPSLEYIDTFDMHYNVTKARQGDRWGFINKEGAFIYDPVFSDISYDILGYYIVKGHDLLHPDSDDLYGLAHWDGNLVLNTVFESITIDQHENIAYATYPNGEKLFIVLDEDVWLHLNESEEDDDDDWWSKARDSEDAEFWVW